MPLQRVVERDALANEALAMVHQQPQVEFSWPTCRLPFETRCRCPPVARTEQKAVVPAADRVRLGRAAVCWGYGWGSTSPGLRGSR
jgi:hypothetical protein